MKNQEKFQKVNDLIKELGLKNVLLICVEKEGEKDVNVECVTSFAIKGDRFLLHEGVYQLLKADPSRSIIFDAAMERMSEENNYEKD